METAKEVKIIDKFFKISIILKGIDGILEIIGGIFLLVIKPTTINRLILKLTQHELSEDPKDTIANYLINLSNNFSISTEIFGSIYLFSHGIIKLILVISLLKRKLWAYPTAIIFFIIFIIYQIYRYSYSHSGWLIILTIFDLFVVALAWLEYRNIKLKSKYL